MDKNVTVAFKDCEATNFFVDPAHFKAWKNKVSAVYASRCLPIWVPISATSWSASSASAVRKLVT